MSEHAGIEVSHEDTTQEGGFGRSSWLTRRFRRLVIGVVISGAVLSATAGLLIRSRRKKPRAEGEGGLAGEPDGVRPTPDA